MKNLVPNIKKTVMLMAGLLLFCTFAFGQYTADIVAGGASIPRGLPANVDDAYYVGSPGPVAAAPNGDLAWADYWEGNLMYWNSSTNVIEMLIPRGTANLGIGGPIADATTGNRIMGITFDSSNNIYFSAANQVLKVDMSDRTLHHIAGSGDGGVPDLSLPAKEVNFNGIAGIVWNHDESILYINMISRNVVAAMHVATQEVEIIVGVDGVRQDFSPAGLGTSTIIREPFGIDYIKDPVTGIEWVYISTQQKTIYRYNVQTNVIYPIAGTGAWNQSGDGGQALEATLLQIHDLAIDHNNRYLYFGDHQGNHHGIRRVDLQTGIIDRYTGMQSSPGLADWLEEARTDPAKRSGHRLEVPTDRAVGVAVDNEGNVVVGPRSNVLFKVDVDTDQIELIAGYAPSPAPMAGPGTPGVQATDMAIQAWGVVTKDGKPHFFDVNSRQIVTLEDDGTTTVLAGNGETGFIGDAASLEDAQFNAIRYMILDSDGNIIASDFGHHAIYKIDLTAGNVTLLAGTGSNGYDAEEDGGPAIAARLNQPHGIRFNNDETVLYITDLNNRRVRALDMATGIISTFAGTGSNGETNEPTAFLEANIQNPRDVIVDDNDVVYVATSQHKKIYKLDPATEMVSVLTPKDFRQPFAMLLEGNTIWVNDELSIKTVDLTTGEVFTVNDQIGAGWAIAKDGDNLYATGRDNGLYLLNVETPAALVTIQGYADADDASALTIALLDELGAETNEFNLDAYKAAVAAETAATLPTVESVQKLVMEVNQEQEDAVLAVIHGMAEADDASGLELFHLAIVGINNVVDANLSAYQTAVANADGVADKAALQALINAGNANTTLALIDAMAKADDATGLSFTLIREAGADPANINQNTFYNYMPYYQAGVEAASEVATQADLDAILVAANAAAEAAQAPNAIAAINDMAVANDADELTFTLIINAEANAELLNYDFLEYYKDAIENASGVADAAELNALLTAANTAGAEAEAASALEQIDAMAIANNASDLSRNMLIAAGASNVMGDVPHFEGYQAGIEAASGVADVAALQAIINEVNLERAILKIVAFADADDAGSMSVQDLADAGVDVSLLVATNIDAYRLAVAAAAGTDVDATGKIQDLVTTVNAEVKEAAIASIIAMSNDGDADELTELLLTDAGMEFLAQYLEAYQDAIATSGGLADAAAIQELLTFTTTCETVKGMAGNEAALDLTIEMLELLNIENTFDFILEFYQEGLFESDSLDNCAASIQEIIDATNFMIVQQMAEFGDATDLTVELLEAVGAVDVRTEKLDDYKSAIEAASSIDDLAALQAIIDEVNVVSVTEISSGTFNVYPNPAKETLNIVSATSISEIRLINIAGQVVYSQRVNNNNLQLSVEKFESGFYTLQITTSNGISVERVIIK